MTPVFLALGDESVLGPRGFAARLHGRLQKIAPEIGFESIAAPGMTAGALVAQLRTRALPRAPRVATVAIGAHDVLGATTPERFEHEAGILIAMLCRAARLVVVHLLPDLALTPRFRRTRRARTIRERTSAFNDVLRAAAQRHGAHVADSEQWSCAAYEDRKLYAEDGHQISDEGHAVWARLSWPAYVRGLHATGANDTLAARARSAVSG